MRGTVIREVRYQGQRSWRDDALPFPNEPPTGPCNRLYDQLTLARSTGRADADVLQGRLERMAAARGYSYPL